MFIVEYCKYLLTFVKSFQHNYSNYQTNINYERGIPNFILAIGLIQGFDIFFVILGIFGARQFFLNRVVPRGGFGMGFFWDPKSHIPNSGLFGIFSQKIQKALLKKQHKGTSTVVIFFFDF